MKTRLIILSLLILLLGVQQISAQTSIPDIEINVGDEESSDSNSGIGRNLTPTIEAQINTLSRLLSFTFNEPVGTVTITVTNSLGETVASSQCNTTIQPFVQLFVPVIDDTYYIYINGNSLYAYGQYVIQGALVL